MGVNIVEYRVRVGLFSGGRGYCPKMLSYIKCTRNNIATDFHLRVFSCCMVVLMILGGGLLVLHAQLYIETRYADSLDISSACEQNLGQVTMSVCPIYDTVYVYSVFSQWRLVMSSDVELNPGPTEDTQQILNAIAEVSASNSKMTEHLKEVKAEVMSVKTEVVNLKREFSELRKSVYNVELRQTALEERMICMESHMDRLEYEIDINRSDMEALSMNYESRDLVIDRVEKQLHYLEMEAKKNNLRIFGLEESDGETNDVSISTIKSKVLKKAYPKEDFPDDLIVFAKRIGEAGMHGSRMVLVKFRSFDPKALLFEVRDSLRQCGIRISNDLTSFQRSELKKLNDVGKRGYFKNGKLFVLEKNDDDATKSAEKVNIKSKSRTFKRQRIDENNLESIPEEA